MKRKISPAAFFAATAFCLVGVLHVPPVVASGKNYQVSNPGEEEPKDKKKEIGTVNPRNNNAVKIYPDAIKRDMHVIAKDKKQIEFFVFDLEGTLVQHYKMKAKDHIRMTGLARGKYQYRVFTGDEETANGQFEIR